MKNGRFFGEIEALFEEIERDFEDCVMRTASLAARPIWGYPVVAYEGDRRIKGTGSIAGWIPAGWRQRLRRLRGDVTRALKRWLPGRKREALRQEEGMPLALFAGDPVFEVSETKDEVTVCAQLPGFAQDDFDVSLVDDRLVIRGDKRYSAEERGRGYFYSESRYGAFSRSVTLPCEIDAERANFKYRNGLLRVTLPKAEGAKPRRIKIQVEG